MGNHLTTEEKVEELLKATPKYSLSQKGDANSFEYRVAASKPCGKTLSLWHDVKLYPTSEAKEHNVVNMINEVIELVCGSYELVSGK